MLPAGLRHLEFGKVFDQPLATGVLPGGRTLGQCFDQPVVAAVLAGLERLAVPEW